MELKEEEIRQLLVEIAAGNPRTLAERGIEILYRNFSLSVRHYVRKNWVQDAGEIEEIVQDTFLEVWRHAERFRGESMFKTWLLGIARHKALDNRRKTGRFPSESVDDMEDTLAANLPPVTDVIQREQVRRSIEMCLESLHANGKLSAAHCEILHLAYVEGQDIGEMAQIVGCPENTVKTRLHYARLRIKDCLTRRLRGEYSHE